MVCEGVVFLAPVGAGGSVVRLKHRGIGLMFGMRCHGLMGLEMWVISGALGIWFASTPSKTRRA